MKYISIVYSQWYDYCNRKLFNRLIINYTTKQIMGNTNYNCAECHRQPPTTPQDTPLTITTQKQQHAELTFHTDKVKYAQQPTQTYNHPTAIHKLTPNGSVPNHKTTTTATTAINHYIAQPETNNRKDIRFEYRGLSSSINHNPLQSTNQHYQK